MAANKTIGGINVTISATIDKFQKNMSAARRTIGTFTKSISGLVFNLKTLGAALAAGGIAMMVKRQFDAIDEISKLSDKLGVSTEMLTGFQLAAGETDISVQELDKALTKLSVKTGKRADVALMELMDRSKALTSQHERLALATEYFGERGSKMVRVLNLGSAGMKEAEQAAVALGLAFDRKTGLGVERAIDAFGRFKMAIEGIFRSLAAEIAPFIELLSVKATSFLTENGRGKGIGSFIGVVIVEMAKNVADSMNWMVGTVIKAVGDLMLFVKDWRTTSPAEMLGFGFKNNQERGAAFSSAAKIRSIGLGFLNSPPSVAIQSFVDEARKQAAEAAAKQLELNNGGGPDLLDQIGGFAKRIGIGPARTIAGAAQGLGGMLSQRFGWMAQAASFIKAPEMSKRPALSFAESGSVESYRQQAAIRRQSDDIAKKQLGVQQQIRDGINNLADVINFPAANLGKN